MHVSPGRAEPAVSADAGSVVVRLRGAAIRLLPDGTWKAG